MTSNKFLPGAVAQQNKIDSLEARLISGKPAEMSSNSGSESNNARKPTKRKDRSPPPRCG